MSDTVYKIFPRYYFPKYTDEQVCSAAQTLKLYSKENISFANFNKVQFIDCGEGLAHIFCPWCGSEIETDLWQGLMSKVYNVNSFECLGITTLCCKQSSSLDELIYVKPCGFATFVIEVHNPTIIPCVVELHEMGKCFGNVNFFRMISAHY
jgi:hypothetical protein